MKRVGLFVGVDKYTHGIQPLRCACSDAHALGFCFARKQFDKVEYLLNEDAVSNAVVEKVNKMTGKLAPGDLFVLYFAGHGREFGGTHYLVGANGYLDPRITEGLMAVPGLLAASEAPGVNRLFILDCCRSDLAAGRSTAYVCPDSRNLSLGSMLKEQAPQGIIPPFILNSCSTGQQAYELPTEKHGVFTAALQQVLEDAARPVRDFAALIDRIDAVIEKLVPPGMTQTLDQSCNPRKWGKVPLFADWEQTHAAPPLPAPVVEIPVAKPPKPAPEKWYRKAAEQGNALAQYRLGVRHAENMDYGGAVYWYRKAAERGHREAQYNLGWCYEYGKGVSQDYEESVKWYRKAAEHGLARAQYNLGVCYDHGKGVPQNHGEAVKWFHKAAKQRHVGAKQQLSLPCTLKRFFRAIISNLIS